MVGMFTLIKLRDDLTTGDYCDPGWYSHPEGSVVFKTTANMQPVEPIYRSKLADADSEDLPVPDRFEHAHSGYHSGHFRAQSSRSTFTSCWSSNPRSIIPCRSG